MDRAHAELHEAAQAYEAFLAAAVDENGCLRLEDDAALRRAQDRLAAAENRLWEVRRRGLGWSRPSWAPPAALVVDWILKDDPGYDDEDLRASRR
jgi:hypothetical protein